MTRKMINSHANHDKCVILSIFTTLLLLWIVSIIICSKEMFIVVVTATISSVEAAVTKRTIAKKMRYHDVLNHISSTPPLPIPTKATITTGTIPKHRHLVNDLSSSLSSNYSNNSIIDDNNNFYFLMSATKTDYICNICSNNSSITNPNTIVDASILNITGITQASCQQLVNAGLSGFITELSCNNVQNNSTIYNDCGCIQYDNKNSSNVPTPIIIPPTNTGICNICYNDPNATIQYPDILVDTSFLGTGTIITTSCEQLYQSGIDGTLLIGWCEQLQNYAIQQQCGCTNFVTTLSPTNINTGDDEYDTCYICDNNPNSVVQNPNAIVDIQFLNVTGIDTILCSLLYNAGQTNTFTSSQCNLITSNPIIQTECDCTIITYAPSPVVTSIITTSTTTSISDTSCYMCYNDPNAIITNPGTIINVSFLNIGSIIEATCQQIYEGAMNGYIPYDSCPLLLDNVEIQNECGCTSSISNNPMRGPITSHIPTPNIIMTTTLPTTILLPTIVDRSDIPSSSIPIHDSSSDIPTTSNSFITIITSVPTIGNDFITSDKPTFVISSFLPTTIPKQSDEPTLTSTTTKIPIVSDMPTLFGSAIASPSDLPTISITTFISTVNPSLDIEIQSDQPTSTSTSLISLFPIFPTTGSRRPTATIPTGSDIPTFFPTTTLLPTTLRGIPEFSDPPTPLSSPIVIVSPSDLPTVITTTLLPSSVSSDLPTSTFSPTVTTTAPIPATTPTGSDIPTFVPTTTLVPTTLRGIPEFSDPPTPLSSPIAIVLPSDLPTVITTTILPSSVSSDLPTSTNSIVFLPTVITTAPVPATIPNGGDVPTFVPTTTLVPTKLREIPVFSDQPTPLSPTSIDSTSDLPTIITTTILPSLGSSDLPTSTNSVVFLPTAATAAPIPATIPNGSDIPTFVPTTTLLPTTLRGIPELSELPTPLSPIDVVSPSDLPTIITNTIPPSLILSSSSPSSILDQPTHLPSSFSTAIKTDPTFIPSTATPTIMPTVSQECYICNNDPNAAITNVQRIIDVRFLNFQGIYDVTCRQLYRLGLDRMIPPNTCVEINNDNNTIQDECGCITAVTSTINAPDRRTKSTRIATYSHNSSSDDEIDATVDISSWSLSLPRITEIAPKEIIATNIIKDSVRPSNKNNDYKGEFHEEQTQKKQKLQRSLLRRESTYKIQPIQQYLHS